MFWDNTAFVYDIFVNVINRKTHTALRQMVAAELRPEDEAVEFACGTGMLTAAMAPVCRRVTATDLSLKMLRRAEKNCSGMDNIVFMPADIMKPDFPDDSFDAVVAGNVIHLLDEPLKALSGLDRICRPGGKLIIPTYMNKSDDGRTSGFSSAVGKAGADFRREFTFDSYRRFFIDAGYPDVKVSLADGRIPCAVAVMRKKEK